MRPELTCRTELATAMRARGFHTQSIEDSISLAVPDFNYGGPFDGWMELKVLDVKEGVLFAGSSKHDRRRYARQAAWLFARWHAGGRAHTLIFTPQVMVLLDARASVDFAAGLSWNALLLVAAGSWYTGDWDGLITTLKESRPS